MKKILLVDDSPEFLRMLSRMVDLLGYNTVTVEDGNQALDKLVDSGAGGFDCVITDVEMPVMSGGELLWNIRRINYDLPVIGMSSSSENRCFLMSQGAWLFFDKITLTMELGRVISEVLKKSAWYRKQRHFPRFHLSGDLLITDSYTTVRAQLCNISKGGMMFEVDKRDRVGDEFSAELCVNGMEIVIERLTKAWESPNDDRMLTGSRIDKIDPFASARLERSLKMLPVSSAGKFSPEILRDPGLFD
jgi:CheY-like chemotaxis protein